MTNNDNDFFLNKSPSFLLKINMLSLLFEEIKNINIKNKLDELYIFINNNFNESKELNILNQDKFIKNNIVSIVIGGEYEFKKVFFQETALVISLADENGVFVKNYIPYDYIIGFYKHKIFIKSENLLINEHIELSEIHAYEKSISKNLLKNHLKNLQLSNLMNNIIKNNMKNLEKNKLDENQIIKITFFEKEMLEDEINNNSNKTKLLVVLIEDDSWQIIVNEDTINFSLKDQEDFKELIVPIKNIVTYLDTKNSLLFNRYVKIIGEDFEDVDLTIYEKENLVFVDFNSIFEEEVTNNFSNIFNIPNIFIKNDKKNSKNENNLIMGNFNQNNSEDEEK